MDHHRSLYKENSSTLNPRQHNRLNRDLQNANRAKQRKQAFQSGRNFAVSPTPQKSQTASERLRPSAAEMKEQVLQNKENRNVGSMQTLDCVNAIDAPQIDKSLIALAVTTHKASEKMSRQVAYIKRFIEFKARKQNEMRNNLDIKKRPFVPVGTNNATKVSFVERVATINGTSETNKLRRSIYTAVPTPPRKYKTEMVPPKLPRNWITPGVAKAVPRLIVKSTAGEVSTLTGDSKKSSASIATSCNDVNLKQPTAGRDLTCPSAADGKDGVVSCAVRSKVSEVVKKSTVKEPTKMIVSNKQPMKQRPPVFAKPLAPPPPPPSAAAARRPIRSAKPFKACNSTDAAKVGSGAVGKAHQLQSKRNVGAAALAPQKNAKLSVSLKAKKFGSSRPPSSVAAAAAAAIAAGMKSHTVTSKAKTAINSRAKLVASRKEAVATTFPIAATPTDIFSLNPFESFVTSTKVKSLSPHTAKPLINSPVNKVQCVNEPVDAKREAPATSSRLQNNVSSAKCALLQDKEHKKTRKFNFVRYSGEQTELDLSGVEPHEKSILDTLSQNSEKQDGVDKSAKMAAHETVVEQKVQNKGNTEPSVLPCHEKTEEAAILMTPPPKAHADGDRPANYLSPFVSVSRGKVSAKKERERRDSIYLPSVSPKTGQLINTPNDVEVRRTLEAVRYFRLQLAGEIERLHSICAEWDKYKAEHLTHLQETGGEDMINVTIGQTKLLTSKKFQQFSGLIDRCETAARNAAAGIAPNCDGSEKTKLITAVDLEGFWSMLNLQVDNVDKRFENLARWKSNDWTDPDEAQEQLKTKDKVKSNLQKVRKVKPAGKAANPSSGLVEMMRKMHAKMRKNKGNSAATVTITSTDATTENRMLTPTRQRRSHGTPKLNNSGVNNSGTPRRISVVVRDRKSLSAAATIISIPATNAVTAAAAAAASQRRRSIRSLTPEPLLDVESPKSMIAAVREFRRSIGKMEKNSGRTELLRAAMLNGLSSGQKENRGSGVVDVSGKNSLPISPSSSTAMGGRKSILKTPGTVKGNPKNVNFSQQLRVRKFKFILDDDQSGGEETEEKMKSSLDSVNRVVFPAGELQNGEEEDSEQRTYQLRTRKVVLRPSSEFEVPRA